MRLVSVPAILLTLSALAVAQNCGNTSIGSTPLNDLGAGTYMGAAGGLYPGGMNVPPPGHAAAANAAAAAIQPLDGMGSPDANGRIVLLSIGMSNTTQEFSTFLQMSNADPNRNPAVRVVDGAQGGQDIAAISNPTAPFWQNILQRLAQNNVTRHQVQAIWFKQALAGPTGSFPASAISLKNQFKPVMGILKQKYPRLRIVFLSSRIYAGYATTMLNPEPFAYESGFAVKWTIQDQIMGDPMLNHDPANGPVTSAVLAWGPYLWADGTTPRSDGLVWNCQDFNADGTHPSQSGRQKVANRLNGFFTNSPLATPWYLGGGGGNAASVQFYGHGCAASTGEVPHLVVNSLPTLGNGSFNVGLANGVPGVLATLYASSQPAMIPVSANGCVVFIDPDPAQLFLPSASASSTLALNPNGAGFFSFQVPNDPSIVGFEAFGQWAMWDAAAPAGFALTRAVKVTVGN